MTTIRIPSEPYFDEYAPAAPTERLTERLHIGAILVSASNSYLPADPRPLTAVLLVIVAGAAKLGWEARELFAMPYDYHQLAWLIPLACFFVAWGNRRAA